MWKLIKRVLLGLAVVLLVGIVGYLYLDNRKFPIDQLVLFEPQVYGNWEQGHISRFTTRIINKSSKRPYRYAIVLSIYQTAARDSTQVHFVEESSVKHLTSEDRAALSKWDVYPIQGAVLHITKYISPRGARFIDVPVDIDGIPLNRAKWNISYSIEEATMAPPWVSKN